MALVIPSATQDIILNKIDDLVNSGGTGYAQFNTTSGGRLARVGLNTSAFAASSGGAMALDTTPELTNTNVTGGTVNHLSFYSSGGTERLQFPASTNTTSGYCYMSSLSLGANDTVEITSCSLNMNGNDA